MTRSKLIEQVIVITDATTAFARGTAGSIAIDASDEGTLQTSATSDGTYTDYADLVKGQNYVDVSGALAYLKVATATGAAVLGDFADDPASN